jgi:hypothetical protein
MLTENSPSLNRVVLTGTSSMPMACATRAPKAWEAEPARIFIDFRSNDAQKARANVMI